MKRFVLSLILLALASPAFAAAPALDASGPFEGGKVMSSKDKSNCKLAIRLAARLQHIKGKITRDQMQTVMRATEIKDAWPVVTDSIQDMVLEDQGLKGKLRGPGEWLQWLLDNFPAILDMIMKIIALFSQNLPLDNAPMVASTAGEIAMTEDLMLPDGTMFVSWAGRGSCATCPSAGVCEAAEAPLQSQTIVGRPVEAPALQYQALQPARNALRAGGRLLTRPWRIRGRSCSSCR